MPAGLAEVDSVLVVEDSRSVRQLLCGLIDEIKGVRAQAAGTRAEAAHWLSIDPRRFFCAVLDLNLPDAPEGEIVDLVRAYGIPVIVLTGSVDQSLREAMLAKQVIDYVIKSHATEIAHVADLVGRLHQNQSTKVLIVDDSASFRAYLGALLAQYRYQVLTAGDGREALEVLADHPDTALVITDYHMPRMSGLELILELRRRHRREELAIIGLSDASRKGLSALMLRSGANDFLTKPFEVEEFYCRVTQNTNMIAYVRQIRDAATHDFLTKAYNRHHLYELGQHLYASAQRGHVHLAEAMIDVDHFKRINDTWGHQVGDEALRQIARALQNTVRDTDIVARYGGEEFVCLAVQTPDEGGTALFERLRIALENIAFAVDGEPVPIAASIGVTLSLETSLEAMLNRADAALYQAKSGGRNRVVVF